MPTIAAALRIYLTTRYLRDRPISFTNDDSLLAKGVVDVFGLLDLVAYLEGRYFVTFDDGEFVPGELDSINKLVAAVEERLMVSPLET